MITSFHIRFATNRQLAALFDTDENTVSRWKNQRHNVSGLLLDRAANRGFDKAVLIDGLDARRTDAEEAKQYQEELEDFLSSSARVA